MNLNLNLKDFLKYLYRSKWLVIIVPVICLIVTYFFVKKMPKKYVSEALISTGMTSQFKQSVTEGQSLDYFSLSQQFGNLLELIQSKRVINMLSYQLILHDLRNPQTPFLEYSKEMKELTPTLKEQAIAAYEQRLSSNSIMSLADNGTIKLYNILKSKGYDEQSLLKKLTIARNGESDFIKIAYTSSNPDLSAFVVNNLANDFISYYTDLTLAGQKRSLAILDTVLKSKQSVMEEKSAALNSSASSAAAAASGAQVAQRKSDMAYQRISEAESQKAQMARTISSIEGAITEINNKLNGGGGYINSHPSQANGEIINIDNQLSIMNQRYINNNFNPRDKATIDSLQLVKSRLISRSTSTSAGNAAAIRQSLIDQKIKLENDLASAKSSMITIDQQLNTLKATAGPITAGGGGFMNPSGQSVARDADIAAREYADVQQKYEQATLAAKAGISLALAEPGLPGPAEPSKSMIFLALAGMSGVMVCLLSLFVTFMLNNTLNTPEQLEAFTHQKVLGFLNYISEEDKDLRKIWKDKGSVASYSVYKDLLRSLRFELNERLKVNENVLGITSVLPGEGKTFLAGSLCYAFAMMGKNVLLISDEGASLMDLVSNKKNKREASQGFESFIVKKEIEVEDRITILNRNPSTSSLLELRDNKSLEAGFRVLKDTFDVVIVDIGSAQDLHSVKEWLMFCDHSVAIYEAGNKLTGQHREVIRFLSSQPGFLGWVLNKVQFKNHYRITGKV